MAKERDLYSPILIALSRQDSRLFRCNSGYAWGGRVVHQDAKNLTLSPYSRIRLLPEGFSDIAGFTSRVIVPADVGKRVAIFSALECKIDGDPTPEQQGFLSMVSRFGGIAGVARSVEEARQVVECDLVWPLKK